jgi:hypothetical protein
MAAASSRTLRAAGALASLSPPLLSLRDEELLLVLSFLPAGSLAACRQVCRTWRRLATEAVREWGSLSEPLSAAFLCTAPLKGAAVVALLAFVGGLHFRPNFGLITLSATFSAKARDDIVRAVGAGWSLSCLRLHPI